MEIINNILPLAARSPYIDPGTGSIIFQIAIAFLIGGLALIKVFWRKITLVFKNLFFAGPKDDEHKD